MQYKPVYVYTTEGELVGATILGENKLQTTNIWIAEEQNDLKKRLDELNQDADIRTTWPHPQDPEVLQLINNPGFHPIEYVDSEALDKENSFIVIDQNEQNADGSYNDHYGDIDESQSVLKYKTVKVPKQPSDVKLRLQDAMETVARNRLAQQDRI